MNKKVKYDVGFEVANKHRSGPEPGQVADRGQHTNLDLAQIATEMANNKQA